MKRTKVAFIAHPLNVGTLSIISGWPLGLLKLIGKNNVRRALSNTKPFIFSKIQKLRSNTGSEIDLIAVACPLLPEQMVGLGARTVVSKIIESVKVAQTDGADIAVLGGFTSVIGNEGEDVAGSVGIPVTSGNTYTAALAIEAIENARGLTAIGRSARVAIIGATGDIGQACAGYFSKNSESLHFVARDQERLLRFADKLSQTSIAKITCHKRISEAICNADIVISATSALTTIIDPINLKPGSIVCDVALPANIAREVSRARRDLIVFEGGLAKVPFINRVMDGKWNQLMPHNAIYGCLAEGLILGFEGLFECYSIGRGNITQNRIETIIKIGRKHGFQTSEYFCGDKFYSQDDIQFVKNATNREVHNQIC